MKELIRLAVEAERERCANIAARCATGIAIEIHGEVHLLGSMKNDPVAAQYATATAIMEAIGATSSTVGK